jgi:hypothetical protein
VAAAKRGAAHAVLYSKDHQEGEKPAWRRFCLNFFLTGFQPEQVDSESHLGALSFTDLDAPSRRRTDSLVVFGHIETEIILCPFALFISHWRVND